MVERCVCGEGMMGGGGVAKKTQKRPKYVRNLCDPKKAQRDPHGGGPAPPKLEARQPDRLAEGRLITSGSTRARTPD